jgi:hypothetical protein
LTAAGAVSAAEVAYNNLNTVAPTVNGLPNEATFSLDDQNFPVGGLVAFAPKGPAGGGALSRWRPAQSQSDRASGPG